MTHVLVVGADTSAAASLREGLLNAGASATRVPDAVAAVEELATGRYDCVAIVDSRPLAGPAQVESRLREAGVDLPVVPVDDATATDRLLEAAADHQFESLRDRRQQLRTLVAELEAMAADAVDRDSLERALVDRLVESKLYRAAWIGRWDGGSDLLEPTAATGIERASLRAVGPGAETPVAARVVTDWEPATAGEGPDATAAVPLIDEEPQGVLQVYADGVDAIEEVERTMLADLGEAVADALEQETEPAPSGTGPSDELRVLGDTLAHELGNQLDAARVQLELAQERDDADHFGRVEAALERIESLAADATALARGDVEPERQQLSTATEEAWATVDTLDATLSVEEGTVEADSDLLSLLLENLFRNAVEHGSTGSRPEADDAIEHGSTADPLAADGDAGVTVRVGPLESGDGFYVADDGPGIPAEEREDVFEWGYTSGSGSGAGLAIVTLVATRHGWTVDLEESRDGGARFVFGT